MAKKSNNKKDIRFLVLDVDGVLTDGGMYYTEGGEEFKKFNAKDGWGIKNLAKAGMDIAFLSSGKNVNLISRRASFLGVKFVYVGNEEKLKVLDKWTRKLGIEFSQVAYIGDDTNDREVMTYAGFSACPADAMPAVKKIADVVLRCKGGEGCVREFIERFIRNI